MLSHRQNSNAVKRRAVNASSLLKNILYILLTIYVMFYINKGLNSVYSNKLIHLNAMFYINDIRIIGNLFSIDEAG
jgi:hypothetical protein